MFTWLQRLRLAQGARRARRPSCRPSLEGLEDRLLLTTGFIQTNLVADTSGTAANTDTSLVDPRGIVSSNTGPFLVADSGGAITSYMADGSTPPGGSPVVTIPPVTGSTTSTPTAIVYNNSATNFTISAGGKSVSAEFLFATADGSIYGWTPGFNNNQPVQVIAGSGTTGSEYTGLTLGTIAGSTGASTATTTTSSGSSTTTTTPTAGTYLYAANFETGTIDVYNASFQKVSLPGSFTDSTLPAGYAPLGIQSINGQLYVTFALQDSTHQNPVTGANAGFVDVFDTSGNFVRRLNAPATALDAPWAVTVAPASFGSYGGDILVGNHGSGQIDAFDPTTGKMVGTLTNTDGQTLTIPGLAALTFGNGGSAGSPNTLYFTAGASGQPHGLFGSLVASTVQPATGQPQNLMIAPSLPFTGSVGSFTSPDPTATPSSFTATIDWGDGTPDTTAVISNGSTPGSFLVGGTHTYNFAGTYSIKVVVSETDTVHDTGAIVATITSPVVVGNANQLYINQLYQDLLGRPAEGFGMSYWNAVLSSTNSRSAVVTGIESSQEYQQHEVENDYRTILGRNADPVGLQFWEFDLAAGETNQMVQAGMMGTLEYFNRVGATTTGLLNGIFQEVLNRAPTQAESQQWLAQLNVGLNGSNLATALMSSSEGASDLVQAIYQRLLHQSADSTTVNSFSSQLQTGAADTIVITAATTSDQYFNNATAALNPTGNPTMTTNSGSTSSTSTS